jgi:hypothetical protein
MSVRRAFALVATLGFLLAMGAVQLSCTPTEHALLPAVRSDEPEAVRCRGPVVVLEFDPAGSIKVRTRGETAAEADDANQRLNDDACEQTAPPHAFSQAGVHYTRTQERTTLTCRFPHRVLVHAYPVSPSWAGEQPAGTAVGLVLERRVARAQGPPRVVLALAVVLERPQESDLVFVRRYCTSRPG